MLSYNESPACDFGVDPGGTDRGRLKFWLRSKRTQATKFHIVEFLDPKGKGTGVPGKIWDLQLGVEERIVLALPTTFIAIYCDNEPLLNCKVDQIKGVMVSVTPPRPPRDKTQSIPVVEQRPQLRQSPNHKPPTVTRKAVRRPSVRV